MLRNFALYNENGSFECHFDKKNGLGTLGDEGCRVFFFQN